VKEGRSLCEGAFVVGVRSDDLHGPLNQAKLQATRYLFSIGSLRSAWQFTLSSVQDSGRYSGDTGGRTPTQCRAKKTMDSRCLVFHRAKQDHGPLQQSSGCLVKTLASAVVVPWLTPSHAMRTIRTLGPSNSNFMIIFYIRIQ
jgi:hypothetical protein